MTAIKLSRWSVVSSNDPYMPPEAQCNCLAGELVEGVTLHGVAFLSGQKVITSQMTAVNGRIVHTLNSTYELVGDPEESYSKWCADHGRAIDPEQPISDKHARDAKAVAP